MLSCVHAQLSALGTTVLRCIPRHIQVYPDRLLPTAAPQDFSRSNQPAQMASMTSTFVSTPMMATRTAVPRPARRSATVCAAAQPEVRLLASAVGTPQRGWTALIMLHLVSASIYRSLQRRGRIRP